MCVCGACVVHGCGVVVCVVHCGVHVCGVVVCVVCSACVRCGFARVWCVVCVYVCV